jgi:hypothetical protein
MKSKLAEVLASSNFRVAIITLFTLALGFNGIETKDAQSYLDIFSKNGTELLIALFTNFSGIALKIGSKIANKTFDFSFWKSTNFLTQAASIIVLIVTALLGQVAAGFISVVLIQLINIIAHSAAPPKYPEITEASDIKI